MESEVLPTPSKSSHELLTDYLREWKFAVTNEEIIGILEKICELVEKETVLYYKMDPDPFDDRHPSRSKPGCTFGPLLKSLFKDDDFMNRLVNNYLMDRDNFKLQITSCRLVLNILPGLETSVVFEDTEGLLDRLLSWARNSPEPLQSYATGLLAAAMDVQDIAAQSKEQNSQLLPIMLKRLKNLIESSRKEFEVNTIETKLPEENNVVRNDIVQCSPFKRRRISSPVNVDACSNSSWADMEHLMIGSSKIYPLDDVVSQRFIYQYLTSLGVYQDLLSFIFEHNVLSLILSTIEISKETNVRLAFDALKYLASLLCHKKFALEFVNSSGIQCLLKVNRQSVAGNGVSYCLNCIAYHDDVMEKICFLPGSILKDLVSYALWLIETSHDSSRSNAMIFFSLSFSYRAFLELFDHQDGLRKILNELSMIDLFSNSPTYTEDEIFTKRQYAKHICFALKRYFEAHLIIKTHSMLGNNPNSQWARLISTNVPAYKPMNFDYELFMEHVEALLHLMPARAQWEPVNQFTRHGAAKLLIQYISMSYDWNFTGKADAVRSALDVFVVCSVNSKFQTILCESFKIDPVDDHPTVGMRIILAAASGEIVNDPDCQRSALRIICNCVCGPTITNRQSINRLTINTVNSNPSTSTPARKKTMKGNEDVMIKVWNCVRFNNGIMRLINLLMTKTPITDADSIRTLSCKALVGLARSDTVRQVIGKLPLFTNGQIQVLMKEPILQDKRSEHIKFCKYCIELIESVTGSMITTHNIETSVGNLNKAEVITQTQIVFNEKQLLQLIYTHLVQEGLKKTAQTLAEEGDLSDFISNQVMNNSNFKFSTPPRSNISRVSRQIPILSQNSNQFTPQVNNNLNNHQTSTSFSQTSTINSSVAPIRINRTASNRVNRLNSSTNNASSNQSSIINRRQSFHLMNSPMTKRKTDFNSNTISLNSIVSDYLRKQHALCKNPVVTCPPFDLYKPHRCPEPRNRNLASVNITSRIFNRQIFPPYGGMGGSKMDRRFIYSRFRPCRSLRCFDQTNFYCCAFSHTRNWLFVGTDAGEVHKFNYLTGEIETTFSCNEMIMSSIEPSWDDKLLLTSNQWEHSSSILWSVTDTLDDKFVFDNDDHVEFGKLSQDKVVGTCQFVAHLYDINVCQLVRTFDNEDFSNKYISNIATFHPSDNLILNDGVLWDVRDDKPVHKFDKFNQSINGVFHPNGQEIISNSEIWDIKTFKLLQTIPALNQSHIKFNKNGDIIYAVYEDDVANQIDEKMYYGTSFRTFDGRDYSSIATIDVKKNISALAIDPRDCFIAIIENQYNRLIKSNSKTFFIKLRCNHQLL
ncbi:hypothetical protein RDWZM_000960 [Blomia tropicalis]|uniref:VPRBP-like protein n=1 Tax=Blomia tropicalis TaxID=40697 RepID=A0A9Q0RQA4_BLOTA|nr:hypothetical protein RDWZM_000960 [Blomia tropicalis]